MLIERAVKMTSSGRRIDCPIKRLLELAELHYEFSTGRTVRCEKFYSMEDEEITNERLFALLWIIDKETPELHDFAEELFNNFHDETKRFAETEVGKMCQHAMRSNEGCSSEDISIAELTSTIEKMKKMSGVGMEEFIKDFEQLLRDKIEEEEEDETSVVPSPVASYFSDLLRGATGHLNISGMIKIQKPWFFGNRREGSPEIKFYAPQPGMLFSQIYNWMAQNGALRKMVKDFVAHVGEDWVRGKIGSSDSTNEVIGLLKEEVDLFDPEKAIRDKYNKCLQNP